MPVPRTAQGLAKRQQKLENSLKRDSNKNKRKQDEDDDDEEEEDVLTETDPSTEVDDEEFDEEAWEDEEEVEEEEDDDSDEEDSDDDEEEEDEELGPDPIHVTVQLSDNENCKIIHFRNEVSFPDFKSQIAVACGLDPKSKFIISRKRKTKPPQQIMTKKHFNYMVDSYFDHDDHFLRIMVTPGGGQHQLDQSASASTMNGANNSSSGMMGGDATFNAQVQSMHAVAAGAASLTGQQQKSQKPPRPVSPSTTSQQQAQLYSPTALDQQQQRPGTSPTSAMMGSSRPYSASTRFSQSRSGGYSSDDDRIRSALDECAQQGVHVTWRERKHLGSGAFGRVVEGVIEPQGFIMAIKHMTFPGTQGDAQRNANEAATMVEEIRLMKNLRHPHIVEYYGSQSTPTEDGGCTVDVFMESCHGGSVTTMRRSTYGGRFPVNRVRDYTRQVLDGLAYLHLKRVVHRDIKGDNVLISSRGFAKLADFGCSKKLGGASFESTMALEFRQDSTDMESNKSGSTGGWSQPPPTMAANGAGMAKTLVGTPLYIAPEVLTESAEGYFESADIWSVGCLVLDLFGKKPWRMQNASVFSVMFAIAQAKGLPTGMPDHFCDPMLLDFLTQCFQREPNLRPTARQLLEHDWLNCPDSELKEPIWSEDLVKPETAESSNGNNNAANATVNKTTAGGTVKQ